MTDPAMTDTPEIHRRPDGSIDTKHYMQIGRQRRSEALYSGGHAIAYFGAVVNQAIECRRKTRIKIVRTSRIFK